MSEVNVNAERMTYHRCNFTNPGHFYRIKTPQGWLVFEPGVSFAVIDDPSHRWDNMIKEELEKK